MSPESVRTSSRPDFGMLISNPAVIVAIVAVVPVLGRFDE